MNKKLIVSISYLISVVAIWISLLIWDLPNVERGSESIFDYALETYSVTFWSAAFFWPGLVLFLGLFFRHQWAQVSGLVALLMVFLCWGLVLLFSALRPEVYTTGYPLCCILASTTCAICAIELGEKRSLR